MTEITYKYFYEKKKKNVRHLQCNSRHSVTKSENLQTLNSLAEIQGNYFLSSHDVIDIIVYVIKLLELYTNTTPDIRIINIHRRVVTYSSK